VCVGQKKEEQLVCTELISRAAGKRLSEEGSGFLKDEGWWVGEKNVLEVDTVELKWEWKDEVLGSGSVGVDLFVG
jgi:hypothetical protein